tara:strand:+ start:5158 stop:5748 length:591 start_codon:yes stop_codon:yes gene_type:complete
MKYLIYLYRIISSFFWDIRYFVEYQIRLRAQYPNYANYAKSKLYPMYMKRGYAAKFIEPLALKYCKGNGLDIGASIWPFKNARPIEDNDEENAYQIKEKDNSVDFIFTSHLIEHLTEPKLAFKEWERVLKKDGVMFFYIPHPACEMWASDIMEYHEWDVEPLKLKKILEEFSNLEILEFSVLPDTYFSYHVVLKKA